MAGTITLTFKDYSGEKSTARVPTIQVDAANLAQFLTDFGAYKTGIAGITIGNLNKEVVTLYDTDISGDPATNPFAQRELKLKVNYQGATSGDKWFMTIPCPDLTAVTFADGVDGKSDYLVLADGGAVAAFVTAFETVVRDPDDTEAVTVTSIQVVGRNN